MKIARINQVQTAASGKEYATTASGLPLFGRKGLKLVEGEYAIYNQSYQTQDKDGKALDTPIAVNLVASVWKTKEAAIEASKEDELTDLEATAFVASRRAVVSAKYNVADMEIDAVG